MPLYLLRHASAGQRDDADPNDSKRPLDDEGRAQAIRLADFLAGEGVGRILTSPYTRCTETVEPTALQLGLPIEAADELIEGAAPERTIELIRSLNGESAVLCTHGDVIVNVLGEDGHAEKGAVWELELNGEGFVRRRYVPPPAPATSIA